MISFKYSAICVFLFCLFSAAATAFAQPSIQWQKCLGGTNEDYANSIRSTKDGGSIVVGGASSNNGDVTSSNGSSDFWVVKLNAAGSIQWQKALGGTGSEMANSVEQTSDDGYIIAGYTFSNNLTVSGNSGFQDFWLVKLDVNGNLQWQKSLGGSSMDYAYSVIQTADGGYLAGGNTSSTNGAVTGNHGGDDGWIVKLDAGGAIMWQKCYGGSGLDEIRSVYQSVEGGYIMTGYTTSVDGDVSGNHGASDLWVIKIGAQGNIEWQKAFGGNSFDAGYKILPTSDGGYMISGNTRSNDGDASGNHGDLDAWLVKIDATGMLQWQKCYGGSGADWAISFFQTPDNNYIVGAQTLSYNGDAVGNHGGLDKLILKISNAGALQWKKCFGGSQWDYLDEIVPTPDGSFISTGSARSNDGDVEGLHGSGYDLWVVKYGPDLRCLPSVRIAASRNNICRSTPVIFSATVNNGGTSARYQWKRNNISEGSNSATFTPAILRHNDQITCAYTSTTSCGRDTVVTSDTIIMTVIDDVTPEVNIAANTTAICKGTEVFFTSTSFFGLMNPSYQWLVNDQPVGTNSTTFSTSTLTGIAQVKCIMTISTPSCIGTTKDHSNVIPVNVSTALTPSATVTTATERICKGSTAFFAVTGNGGTNALYNGLPTGDTGLAFSTASLVNGDKVSCTMTLDASITCFSANTAQSNEISMAVSEAAGSSVSLTATATEVCAGQEVRFTALPMNAGTQTNYQWLVNGTNSGSNGISYTTTNLVNGDQVSCAMSTNNPQCPALSPAVSNRIQISVKEVPAISFSPAEYNIMSGQQVQLNAKVAGSVASYQWSPVSALVNAQTLTPQTTSLTATTVYNLKAISVNGCAASKDIIVKVFMNLYIPTAFTPNGDGKNDVFRIPAGSSIDLKLFSIFDRWGNRVFHTTTVEEGWNGSYKGRPMNSGVFIWMIKAVIRNEEVLLKGTVSLIH